MYYEEACSAYRFLFRELKAHVANLSFNSYADVDAQTQCFGLGKWDNAGVV